MTQRDDSVFIEHILESINAIEKFSRNIKRENLYSNRLRRSAIVKEIEIIGEAVRNVSYQLKEKYPEIEWKKIIGTRDKLSHHYFGIDVNIVWEIVKMYIPALKKKILEIKFDLKKDKK
ncbi:MAG TPA: DUF86 domain-containing protein [Candidatus Nanoarchaeia archaeon]|nr:DUF86 domain-containing protein [Candidatus Nanoarchaeia archaeon]